MLPFVIHAVSTSFQQADEEAFRSSFPTLIADSYSAPLPAELHSACRGLGVPVSSPLDEIVAGTASTITAAEAGAVCGDDSVCVIPSGSTLRMDGNLRVAALVVRGGAVEWTDESQQADAQWLCAGYVAVTDGGTWRMNVTASRAFIYVMANRAVHATLGARAFGAVGGSLELSGRPLRRTWSLLAVAAAAGVTRLELMHDAAAMGWAVGDRLVIAPTTSRSLGTAEQAEVAALDGTAVLLRAATTQAFDVSAEAVGGRPVLLSAEVTNAVE